ncbi:MAG: efflux RND transporter periplasmic adaptor subunit [candidate division WOR-3 bacterium]
MKQAIFNRFSFPFLLFLMMSTVLISCAGANKEKVDASMIGKEVICPVTGEKFKITQHTRFVDYQGKRYYFCCPGCDKQFLKDPEKYINQMHETGNKDVDSVNGKRSTDNEISYYTCSMHPQVKQDKPGKCPICGMELIPVYKGSENRITISEEKIAVLKIKSAPVERKALIKKVEIPAKVVKDEELYIIQQELLTAKTSSELLNSVILKLRLMGFSNNAIKMMIEEKSIDESFILPSQHRAWLIADVYEQDIALIKTGQKAKIKFSAYPEKEFSGIIVAIEPRVNPETRRAKARILLNHPMVNLYTDMYGNVIIESSSGKSLAIPYSSIIDTGRRKMVYVEVKPGIYELRSIKTGIETDEYVQVVDGLSENEKVVVDGNFLLDSQTTLAGGQSLLYGSAEEVKEMPSEQPQHRH